MSAYRVAINQTTQTIDRRAKYFRNLVVAVVFVGLGSIGWALVAWAVSPLSVFFLLFPICGFYFLLDARLLNAWRTQLFESWTKRELDLQGLCAAVGAIPMLPKETLQSMLATLPSAGDLVAEQRISSSTRQAIASAVTTIHTCRSDAIAFKAAGYAIAAVSLIVAVALRLWQPLLAIVAVAALPLSRKFGRLARLRVLRRTTLLAQQQPDFNQEKYAEIVATLRWEPIRASEKPPFLYQRASSDAVTQKIRAGSPR